METKSCRLCGAVATDTHHLLGGRNRTICDQDQLTIPLCRPCHSRIHEDGKAELKCKALGQELYELRQMITRGQTEERARENFRRRYGKNYI